MSSPLLPVRSKQPGEKRTLTFEFGPKLALGDTLTGTPVLSSTPSGLTFTGPTIVSTRVNVQVSGGTDGSDYQAQCQCNTSSGDILQLDVQIEVRETAN